jgi:NitT/TauT family transport system substrate-binding protein
MSAQAFIPTRRSLLAGFSAIGITTATGTGSAKQVSGLEILGAPNASTIVLVRLLDSGGLASVAPGASFRLWRDTDELRAGIVSGRSRLFTTPTHVPANLANRGLPLKLLGIVSMGHLSVVTSEPSIQNFTDLAGRPVLGFFRNDMPDLVFRADAKMEGLDPDKDVKLAYVGSPMEAAQLLAAGRVETAILPEPAATAAIMMAKHQGKELRRALNLQDVWVSHKGGKGIPMAGIAVHASLLDEAPELPSLLENGLPQAREWVFANRQAAAELAERTMQFKAPMFLASLDHSGIDIVSAKTAKGELTAFYQTIHDFSPDTLGGRLPGDDFYLDL